MLSNKKGIPLQWDHTGLAKDIIIKSKSFAASSRSIFVSNDKIEKKVIKLKLAGRSDTAIFAQILLLVRRQAKHKGIQLIRVGDKDWLNLKESCKLATEFCNEFGLPIKEGYKEYIKIGLGKMKNFSVFKFKTIHPSIFNEYEAKQVIERDKTPAKTLDCHSIYLANINSKIGYAQSYISNPEKYQYFVLAKEEAQKLRVSNEVYITAQFAGLEWANVIPDPAQLVGPNSMDRLQKYCFTHNIKIGEKTQGVIFKKIR